MSLIYSALNKLEQNTSVMSDAAAVNPYVAAAERPGVPRWVYGVVAGCLALVLGGWLAMNALQAKYAATPVHAPVGPPMSPALSATPTNVAPIAVSLPSSIDAVPVMTPVVVAPSSTESLAAKPTSRTTGALAKPVQAKPPARILPKQPVQMITEEAPAPEINPEETTTLTREVKLAIQAGKYEDARSLLKQLATRLPAESITLLRLNAWLRMQSGDSAQAMVLYRQIVDRLPGDETAGINLALLHLKAGQQEEARRLIGALAERHPESEMVQKYYREIGAPK